MIFFHTPPPSLQVLKVADKLMCVGCFCIGTDQTDLNFAASRGIPVFNAPYANTRSVSELVLAEIIMLARQATDRSMECHRGEWNKTSTNWLGLGESFGGAGASFVFFSRHLLSSPASRCAARRSVSSATAMWARSCRSWPSHLACRLVVEDTQPSRLKALTYFFFFFFLLLCQSGPLLRHHPEAVARQHARRGHP